MEFISTYLRKKDGAPLYHQLYANLAEEIRSGSLAAGEKLPGKRSAAAQLGVSVNTVDEAYQMLAAEGYVEARPRSGFVVRKLERLPAAKAGDGVVESAGQGGAAADAKPLPPVWQYSFSSGGLDTGLFPHKTWGRLLREVLGDMPQLFDRGDGQGEAALREAIVQYLRGFRAVRCQPEQVVVGAGLEVLCSMLARLLPDKSFAVEDPGYPKAIHILQNMGVRLAAVPVDTEGMQPEALRRSGAQVAYLTPSHQFPTGGVMPVGRRMELLHWAAGEGRLIIEDDYDSEFRFDGRPLPCLQGLDEADKVVYAGTFTRSLAPGLRVAYLVLPPGLLHAWGRAYGDYACSVPRPEQHTLARLMEGGHFARNLNRMRTAYRKRRDLVLQALAQCLPAGAYAVENAHTGLYMVLRLPGRDAAALAKKARAAGVYVRALEEYRADAQRPGGRVEKGKKQPPGALVLGYGGLRESEITGAVRQLAGVILAG